MASGHWPISMEGAGRLISRRGNEMKRFNDLSDSIAKELRAKDAILDGEIVTLDAAGVLFLQSHETAMPSRLLCVRYSLVERPRPLRFAAASAQEASPRSDPA